MGDLCEWQIYPLSLWLANIASVPLLILMPENVFSPIWTTHSAIQRLTFIVNYCCLPCQQIIRSHLLRGAIHFRFKTPVSSIIPVISSFEHCHHPYRAKPITSVVNPCYFKSEWLRWTVLRWTERNISCMLYIADLQAHNASCSWHVWAFRSTIYCARHRHTTKYNWG